MSVLPLVNILRELDVSWDLVLDELSVDHKRRNETGYIIAYMFFFMYVYM
jgi:hypothetical protein